MEHEAEPMENFLRGIEERTGGGVASEPIRCSSCNKLRPQNCEKNWTICNTCVQKRKRKRDAQQCEQILDHFTTEFSCEACSREGSWGKLCPIHHKKLQKVLMATKNNTTTSSSDNKQRGNNLDPNDERLSLLPLEAHTFFTQESNSSREEEGKICFKDCFIRVPSRQRELLMAIENMAAKLVESHPMRKSFNEKFDSILLLLIAQITEEVLEESLKEGEEVVT